VLRLAGVRHVLASSTNPTLPFGRDAVAEHVSMIMTSHGLHADLPGDVEIARQRVRAATMGAENLLHDLGVIPITSSDAQGMGRAGETVRRTVALAAVTKGVAGGEPDDGSGHDNARVLRFLAKLTVNPALAHGLAHEVGSLQAGLLADIVLWAPATFGAKPTLVLKAGLPAWGVVGDPNATIPTSEPLVIDRQFGAHGAMAAELSVLFTNGSAVDAGSDTFATRRRRVPVRGTRSVDALDMVRHGRLGQVRVAPGSAQVELDGVPLVMEPVERVPLARLYFL
jgi:urease subunit alpha